MRRKLTTRMEQSAGKVKFRRFRAMPLSSQIAVVVLTSIVLIAILAPFLAPHDPLEIYTARQAPSGEFLFGTDEKGRDVLSRMMYGARYSLVIGLGATLFALVLGAIIGSFAAVSSKGISEVTMRIMDIIMSFPGIALAAVFVSVFGNSLVVIIFAIGFLYIPQLTRVVRANVMAEYGEDYVRASIVSGASSPWILVKHVVRNTIAPVMVFPTVLVADSFVFEGSLSFIQAGIQEPTATNLGQHPGRRPLRGPVGSLVAGAVPGPGNHVHRPISEHPFRRSHRRHGGGAQSRSAQTRRNRG